MIPRDEKVLEIINVLMENSTRLVTVHGNLGMGKKFVTDKVAYSLLERNKFKNGVLHILI